MRDVNRVWLSGVVATEPIMTCVGYETPSTTFILKVDEEFVDRSGKQRFKSNFITVESLGKWAAKTNGLAIQGKRLWVEGYIRQDRVDDKDRVRVRTFALYNDSSDSSKSHIEGAKAALDLVRKSWDLNAAIKSIEQFIKSSSNTGEHNETTRKNRGGPRE